MSTTRHQAWFRQRLTGYRFIELAATARTGRHAGARP
jgi:hypothetical protein